MEQRDQYRNSKVAFFLFLLLSPARADVLQQQIKTQTVNDDALVDADWPSAIGTHNDITDTQTWTNNNGNVRLDSSVTVVFNELIQAGYGYITFQPPINSIGSSSATATTISVPSADVQISGTNLAINLAPRLSNVFAESTTYTVSFDAGVIQDLNSPADSNAAFSVQFTTGDFSPPTRTGISPTDGTPSVSTSTTIVLTFSEAIQANQGSTAFDIEDYYQRQTPYNYHFLCKDTNVVISGNQATITVPTGTFPLLPCQKYTMIYDAKCFYDTSVNKNWIAALPAVSYYSFWTSCITDYSPAINTIDHLIDTNVVLTFAESITPGTGNIVLTMLGETPQTFDVTDSSKVTFNGAAKQVTVKGNTAPNYLCQSLTMQQCKGKPIDVSIDSSVIHRSNTAAPAPSLTMPTGLTQQLTGTAYRFTLKAADLTPPDITIVSMYGISESVIRITVRLDETGTTWCRAFNQASFTPGTQVPTLNDCAACNYAIKDDSIANYVYNSGYDAVRGYAEHEVDVTHLTSKTQYWVYCYSHDNEIPTNNVVTSAQMLATQQLVRTLDTTPPTFGTYTCVPTPTTETSITVTLSLNEGGRAYCKVVERNFVKPSPNAVIAEGFYADSPDTNEVGGTDFTIKVNEITTGLGATGMQELYRKTDYDVYCWAQDDEGYPYHGPNGMADVVFCPMNYVTTLDLTRPNMRFVMAESISNSQILITLQVDEGARVWCAAWAANDNPSITASNFEAKIKGNEATCMDNKGRQCGTFWIYDLDDLEDTTNDGVVTQADYDSTANWKYNQDVDIIVFNLIEKTDYPYIYCYAEDDDDISRTASNTDATSGVGSNPNKMMYDASGNAGPWNVHTIKTGIGTRQTLDESPPSFTKLSMRDPTAYNDRIIVTFSLNEAGTAYCRVTRSDSGETTLRINRILTANYGQTVANPGDVAYITVDKLESTDAQTLYEAAQYDVYCWAKDSAVDTQNEPRPNYMIQDYVDTLVGGTMSNAISAPNGGKTTKVWVIDTTPPEIIYVSSEALTQDTIQITLQLNEPGTVWCHPTNPVADGTYLDTAFIDASTYKPYIKGRSGSATFVEFVHTAYYNVDVEVNKIERRDGSSAVSLSKEVEYNIYCFAEDDWLIEAQHAASKSINFDLSANAGAAQEITYAKADHLRTTIGLVTTLDLTPPSITITGISSVETEITVTLRLDETGTAWCQAVRHNFDVPTILEILDTNFVNTYSYAAGNPSGTTTVLLTGYNRPKNAYNNYLTPLVLGTDYDVYCYADDDLCLGCKVTNGVSFSHVANTKTFIRTKDYTRPNMRYVTAESIAHDQILITLQVHEGSKVWCAAWSTDPGLISGAGANNYETKIKNYNPTCKDNKGRTCGTFWVYDLDDLEDDTNDGLVTQAQYDHVDQWKYNEDVDIILYGLTEKTDYPYIYCYAEDDEVTPGTPNKMIYDTSANYGPDNVFSMKQEIGTVQTLDESPPSFTKLSMRDPTEFNDRIIVTFTLNEAGTAYCRVTRSDSGETTLRINRILTANYGEVVAGGNSNVGYITVDKLEASDSPTLYEAAQYDVYCWAKDSAVDTQQEARPNYMIQNYVDIAVSNVNAPSGGKTLKVWVKDMTPPTVIYVSNEALTEDTIQITLQLNEPGTVWCHPVFPNGDSTYIDKADVTSSTYISYIKGRHVSFMEYVPTAYYNVDVEVNKLDKDDATGSAALSKEVRYNIYCFAEDDWKIEAQYAAVKSENYQPSNLATPSISVGNGNEITMATADNLLLEIGDITTLDLTPPSITITGISSVETAITVTLRLDETGTAWCQAVNHQFDVPTILEILDTNFYNTYSYDAGNPTGTTTVLLTGYNRPKNAYNTYLTPLRLGIDYDVYCYADDDLCLGCKVTNGVSFSHVSNAKTFIRTKDYTKPNMRYVTAESIANDQILITLQVDEGSRVWCAAWSSDPGFTSAVNMESKIKNKESTCFDNKGRQCGTFWIYDLDDLEDDTNDGMATQAHYDHVDQWKYNEDVDIILYALTEKTDYPFIYCYSEDDEGPPNKMQYDTAANSGPNNVYTMKQEIGTVKTLDESPPSFTRLALQDPTAFNDRLIVTFQLNEAGTAYCRTTRSDSGETTLRINRILTANYGRVVAGPSNTGYITVDKLESSDDQNLYEAAQYDIYCWAKDSTVDTQNEPRPNYQVQGYVETFIGSNTAAPNGGKTLNVWINDATPPTIIVVSHEALAEDVIQVTLQLNEPGTLWCQAVDKDSSSVTTAPGGYFCRDMDVNQVSNDRCEFENFIKGVNHGTGKSTVFRADVHVPYQDYDIDVNRIEKVTATTDSFSLTAQYHYKIWCYAEDDWRLEAMNAPAPSPLFQAPANPNKIPFSHATAVKDTIGQILTLDTTPPTWTSIAGTQFSETVLKMTMTLDEAGTIWCKPVRQSFAEPSINEILQNNEYNTNCGASACTVTMQGLQSKTAYDIWCYNEDDNVYPQIPNGRKFSSAQKTQLTTLDTTPPILTIVEAESPVKTDIRIKIKMEEPGTVWCNSFITGTSYGTINFDAIIAGNYKSYVGLSGQTPGGPIDTNVEVIVTDRIEQTQYDTYCTAQDVSSLPSINKLVDATTISTQPAIGRITTLDESPPIFTKLGAKGITENTIQVTFKCNEACRSYCRVTRSDSGENSLSINRILKASYMADQAGPGGGDQTIQLSRLENDASLQLLERGTLYDIYCWIRDEALQYSCRAKDASAACETFPKPNNQGQVYVDTAFGGTPPALKLTPFGGKMLHVRTPDITPPNVIFIEAESTEETSITVTLQLDEPGTAYCKAFTSTKSIDSALYNELTTGSVYKNTVTNWNNIYKNFEVKVTDLTKETKHYVYCVSEDDEVVEGSTTIDPSPSTNNRSTPMLTESTGRFTLDLTPPIITMNSISSSSETTSRIFLRLDEPGTAWCKAVRDQFDSPTINQIIAANFFSTVGASNTEFSVQIQNLERDTEYDVYCHARDRGTEVTVGSPDAGNPGNDATFDHVLSTKRDIHTMGDSTAPTIVSVVPVHQMQNVNTRPNFQIVFNEDIQAGGSGYVVFTPETGSALSLDVTQVGNGLCIASSAKMTITSTTLSVDFSTCTSQQLDANLKWYVSYASGVFKDASPAKNDIPAFGASNSYYFQTAR